MISIKVIEEKIICYTLALLLFSATALYTIETNMVYIGITLICLCITMLYVIKQTSVVSAMLRSKFCIWISIVLLLISVDAVIRGHMIFNYDYNLFTWISLMMIWALLYRYKGTSYSTLDLFTSACEIATVGICLYMLLTNLSGFTDEYFRIGDNLSGNVNTVGKNLGFLTICVLYRYLKTGKIFSLCVCVLATVMCLLTGSKQVLFCLLIMIYLYLKFNKKYPFKFLVLLLVIILGVFAILNIPALYSVIGKRTIDFLGNMGLYWGEYEYSNSTAIRKYLIEAAWQGFLQKPLLGGGYQYVSTLNVYKTYAHMNYLEILADYGLLGFIGFYGIYLYMFNKWKIIKYKNYLFACLPLALLMNDLLRDIVDVAYTEGVLSYVTLLLVDILLIKYEKGNTNWSGKKYNVKSGILQVTENM